jgi:hypothetical protein
MRAEGLGKFKNSPHRVSNQRPSGLWHSALTTTLPCAPNFCVLKHIKSTKHILQNTAVATYVFQLISSNV